MSRGTAVQLNGSIGGAARVEARWIARASISLPVPVSPVTRIESGVGAMRRATLRTSDIGSEAQMHSGPPAGASAAPTTPAAPRGRPQRRALLLVAAVALERQGRVHELADGDERAAMLEL